MNPRQKLAVLISNKDSNLQAILDACTSGELNAGVAVVISDQRDAASLERARRANIPTLVKVKPKMQERREYDAQLAAVLAAYRPDWIVLSGWTRNLTRAFLDRFPERVISIHPALPEAFPGTLAVERAFYAYCRGEIKRTGVTVHLVSDEDMDSGPILAQEVVPIRSQDTIESLEARVQAAERRLLISTLKQLTHDQLLPDFQTPLSSTEE